MRGSRVPPTMSSATPDLLTHRSFQYLHYPLSVRPSDGALPNLAGVDVVVTRAPSTVRQPVIASDGRCAPRVARSPWSS